VARESLLARLLRGLGRVLQWIPVPLAALLSGAWAGLIWYVSSLEPPGVGSSGFAGGWLTNLAHAPEFGMLTLWLCLALPRRDGWARTDGPALRAVALAVALYAVVDELHQGSTELRDGSVFDVLTDVTAALSVLLTVRFGGGEHADARRAGQALAWGGLACLVAALLATAVPRWFPGIAWF